jgi:hypothetical protein
MRLYTVSETFGLMRGFRLENFGRGDQFYLGGGIASVHVEVFRKNPPKICDSPDYGPLVLDGRVFQLRSGRWVLAKDNRNWDQLLLRIETAGLPFADRHYTRRDRLGYWDRHSGDPIQILRATAPLDYYAHPQDHPFNWARTDAVVRLGVSDAILFHAQYGKERIVSYVSKERGLEIV